MRAFVAAGIVATAVGLTAFAGSPLRRLEIKPQRTAPRRRDLV
jgi:hypothetical protein